jgi:hypothetical protein
MLCKAKVRNIYITGRFQTLRWINIARDDKEILINGINVTKAIKLQIKRGENFMWTELLKSDGQIKLTIINPKQIFRIIPKRRLKV